MTLADQIREIDFDVPARVVAEELGCSPHYVRGLRSKTRNPDIERNYYLRRDPEKKRLQHQDYYKRNRERIIAQNVKRDSERRRSDPEYRMRRIEASKAHYYKNREKILRRRRRDYWRKKAEAQA